MIYAEPSADIRKAASILRQFLVALVEQGFTEEEALSLCKVQLAATIRSQREGEND